MLQDLQYHFSGYHFANIFQHLGIKEGSVQILLSERMSHLFSVHFLLRYFKFFQFFIHTVWLYSLVFLETPFLFGGKVLEPSGQYLWWAELYSIAFTHIKITRILYIIIPLAISDFNLSNKILRQQDLLMCVQGLSVIVQINILQCKAWI